ncbi:MAG TPA: galactose oxidase-like domain-containing protein [Mycobacterium sp.]|nr:galactose oxidase-like domain-containing protein [Mycobacterium sp.]
MREHPADHWLPGVECDAGPCLDERWDRRSSTFALAPDCWQTEASAAEAGINAQSMTLIGDGQQIVFAAKQATNADGSPTPGRIATARFDPEAGGDGACPEMKWPRADDVWVMHAANGAHVVGPDGRFWSFGGDVAGTRGVRAFDWESGWAQYPFTSLAPPLGDDPNWNMPNALAIALPGSGVAIARGVASNDPLTMEKRPTSLEWWTFGPDRSPVWVARAQLVSGTLGYGTLNSLRGQARLLSVGACAPDDRDGVGNRLVVLGDNGRAVALPTGDSPPLLVADRPVDAPDDRPNYGSATVLLPLRAGTPYAPGSVLYIGGGFKGDVFPELRRRLDLFDPACRTWTRAGRTLPRGRNFATAVLLPDGSILLAGDDQGARDIFYIDPTYGFAVTVGHDMLQRMRGTGLGGLVLSDGRVVLAGGTQPDGDDPRAPPDVDLWEPPYLHAGAQPTIARGPGQIPIDAHVSIEVVKGGPDVTEVVLLAYGSSFMGNNPNQRLIELAIDRNASDPRSGLIALTGPPARWAPTGRYLLFALTADRIPSRGVPVDVVDAAAGP